MLGHAHAKVNLYLRVLGKRPDGYHEIRSVMQTVGLCDDIQLELLPEGIEILSDHPTMPKDSNNIMYRAIELFRHESAYPGGARIQIIKRIPVSAGLGGGSSDAATVLNMMNELTGFPLTDRQMLRISADLGSDVVFFLNGGTALAQGRGELIFPMKFIGKIPIVLINLGFPVSTAEIYKSYRFILTSDSPDFNIATAFSSELSQDRQWKSLLRNDLESVVFAKFPEILTLKRFLDENGAEASLLSGSGGTLFGIFSDGKLAEQVYQKAESSFRWAAMTDMVDGVLRENWGVGKR